MAVQLQLAFLGDLQITLNDIPLAGFDSNKARALLTYLAVTGRPHFRQSLIGLLWGDMPETEAKANLRVVLSNLRKVLEPYLTITRDTVAFNRDTAYRLDVEEFLTQLGPTPLEARIDCLQRAVELYRGDFLDGFYVREAPDFEEWVLGQRERFKGLALNVLHTLSAHYAGQGEAGRAKAIDYTTRLLVLDPWREEAHQQLMLLLARSGQHGAALAQYETCRRALAEGLGVQPAPETTALYNRIRTVGSSRRHNLPAQVTSFIGREKELAKINQQLANPACRLLTLTGPGGIGKTRLALEAAQALVERFLEGVYFVPLDSLSAPDFLASTIGAALKFTFQGIESSQVQLLNYLAEKEMLLVLDNFEHLLAPRRTPSEKAIVQTGGYDGTRLLAELLQHAPGVKLLVTSRERLNLQGEWVLEIGGLDYPGSLPAPLLPGEGLENYSAFQLFWQSAGQVRADLAWSDEDKTFGGRICQLVQGLPLGLELAAAWVHLLSCREIAEEIERNLDFLATSLRDVPERHRSLRAVFNHSWQILSAEEQRVFRQLAVFLGGFRRDAAENVVGASLPVLAGLVEKSLLNHDTLGRYTRHTLLWQFAHEKLEQFSPEKEKIQALHCAYYAGFLQQQAIWLRGGGQQKEALEEIGVEIENVRLAWQWAINQQQEETLEQFILGLQLFYSRRGWLQEGEEVFSRAVASFGWPVHQVGEPPEIILPVNRAKIVGQLLVRYGYFCLLLGQHKMAGDLFQESLVLLRQAAPVFHVEEDIVFVLNQISYLSFKLGEYETGQEYLQESLSICQANNDQYSLTDTLNMLGILADVRGEYEQAKQFYQQCLTVKRQLNDSWGIARALHNLADTLRWLAEYELSKQLSLEALIISKEIGEKRLEAFSLNNLGDVALSLGEYEAAAQYLQESLALFKAIGERWGLAVCLQNLGLAAKAQREYQNAKWYWAEALKTAMDTPAFPLALDILSNLAKSLILEATENAMLTGKAEALKLFVLILNHPAAYQHTKNDAAHFKPELEGELPREMVIQAQTAGQTLTLEAIVAEITGRRSDEFGPV